MQTGLGRSRHDGVMSGRRVWLLATAALFSACPGAALAQQAPEAESDATVLQRIVVTATGFEQNVEDAPASITVITREDIEKGAFSDLTDALREVQGVAVTGVANEKDIFIRGLPGAYTLILVDGKRQNTRESRPNGNSGYEQRFIPPLPAIERIEVIRGPMSSLYGSDAMGGVINIITRKVSDVWSGSVTIEGTAQQHSRYGNSIQSSLYASGPIIKDTLGLQLWGRGFRRGEDKFLNGIQGAIEGDIAGRLTYTPNEDHDIYLEGDIARVRSETSGGKTLADTANDSYRDFDHRRWAVSHTGRWGPTTSEFSFMQEWGERTTKEYSSATDSFVANPRVPLIRNSVLDGKFTTPFEMFGDHTLVTGGQFQNAALTDRGHLTVDQNMSVNQWALFLEDEWRITDSFALTGGLRYDNHETYGGHFSPRLYGVYHLNDALTFKGGVSTGFRAPEIRQVAPGYYMPTQQGAGMIAANPDLAPEKSLSYEASALWDSGSGITAGVTLFHTDFKNKISNMNTGTLIDPSTGTIIDPLGGAACNAAALAAYPGYYCLWQNFNIDDAVIQGVELTASWEALPTLDLRASYTYTHSEQKTGTYAGFPLARTPAHRASLRADWITPIENLSVWGTATYHGSEILAGARIGTNGKPITINGQAGRKYDPYMLFDLGLSYEVNEKVRVNGAVYNVFDKVIDPTDYNTIVEGRRFWFGMTTTF